MRRLLLGFAAGIIVMLAVAFIAQRWVVRQAAPEISYRFDHYVFTGPAFPKGDFEPGRLVHRLLFPSHATVRFYDADYNEVHQAAKPGRYGAVVRLDLPGQTLWRFVTLYRTAAEPSWWSAPWPSTVEFPAAWHVGSDAVQWHRVEIGEILRAEFVGRGDASPKLAVILAGLSDAAFAQGNVSNGHLLARDENWWYGLREKLQMAESYRYLVDLPKDYDTDPSKRWPLILYLHSGAERGSDLAQVRRSGLAKVVGQGRQLPAIVVSPQCPEGETWSAPVLDHLLTEVAAKYRVDSARVYATGGSETLPLAATYPSRFAAIVPIGGSCLPEDATSLAHLPIWAFAATQDTVSPARETVATLDAVRQAGGHPHVTVSNAGPDIWDQVYTTDAMYTWLLAQSLQQPEVLTPGVPSP